MQFWQAMSWCETDQLVAVAQTAEELGFDGLILPDHIFIPRHPRSQYPYAPKGQSPLSDELEFPDPLIAAAALAMATRRMRFMTGVYLLALRHPIEVAKNVATLDRLSGGRFVLGVGSGWLEEEYEQFGVDFARRGARLDEAIDVLRLLWRGEPVDFTGDFFRFPEMQIRPIPSAPVPIFGGGIAGPALRRSATRCDGWLGPGNSLEESRQLLRHMRREREAAGLSWEGFELIAPLNEGCTPESVVELAALGVRGTVNYPFLVTLGPDTSLWQKQDGLARFARDVIEPVRRG